MPEFPATCRAQGWMGGAQLQVVLRRFYGAAAAIAAPAWMPSDNGMIYCIAKKIHSRDNLPKWRMILCIH